MRFEDDINRKHKDEVTIVKFLNPLPLLLTAVSKGVMFIWLVRDLPEGRKCIIRMENTQSMTTSNPLTAVDSFYDEHSGTFLLLIGDETGWIKIQDISIIPKTYDLKPLDFSKEAKRNPWRPLALEEHTLDRGHEEVDDISDDAKDKD